MWYEKFLNVIDASWIGKAAELRMELIEKTDPENIYVENIRSFFNMPYRVARFFCELAVREGVFSKRIGYLCPKDKNIAQYIEAGEAVPEAIVCHTCEAEGEEVCEFDPVKLQTIEVYSLPSA
ncbi:MAG TPA: hypothetical protein VGM86_16705 [Thermoanaerobaculia bacterium]|jgi:hypothetical protein